MDRAYGARWRSQIAKFYTQAKSGGRLGTILLHEKFLQFYWLRVVVFQLNLKYLHVKITNLVYSIYKYRVVMVNNSKTPCRGFQVVCLFVCFCFSSFFG